MCAETVKFVGGIRGIAAFPQDRRERDPPRRPGRIGGDHLPGGVLELAHACLLAPDREQLDRVVLGGGDRIGRRPSRQRVRGELLGVIEPPLQ